MPAHPARRTARVAATLTTCALALAAAGPATAKPVGPPPADSPRSAAPTSSLAGTTSPSLDMTAPGTDVAAPDQQNPIPGSEPAAIVVSRERPQLDASDEGATTLAVVLIAAGALVAGASAGFAGGRRAAPRLN